jgi:sulfur-oxidizing protein SoxY
VLARASAVGVAVMAGLLKPGMALADWNKAGFEAKDLNGALASIGGTAAAASGDISVKAPDIAENGAVVPVEISSNIAGTESIAIVGEKNALPLIADFKLMNGGAAMLAVPVYSCASPPNNQPLATLAASHAVLEPLN